MKAGERRVLEWSERAYALLLRLYPRSFRRAVGREMREAFRDRARWAVGRGGLAALVGLWPGVVWDAVRNGVAERWGWSRAERWSAARETKRSRGRWRMAMGFELRSTVRRLVRAPVFSLVSMATVAVGVAAFASIFSIVHGVLLAPFPYEEPDELVYVWRDYTWADFPRGWVGGVDVLAMRGREDVFEGVTALRSGRVNLAGRDGSAPAEARVILASANFFELLGVEPALGRGFAPGEDEVGAAPVAVLGHDLWRTRHGADASIVGREIYLNGDPVTVVGVADEDFRFAMHSSLGDPTTAELYLPLRMDLTGSVGGEMAAVARLADGVAPDRVSAGLAAVSEAIDEAYFQSRGLALWTVDLREDLVGEIRPALLALVGSAVFLLLILALNLALLFLSRAARRRREIGVRLALGAGRARLARGALLEGALLAAAGGVAGLLLAAWGTRLLVALAPADLPRLDGLRLDPAVMLAGFAAALGVGLLGAAGPAIRSAAADGTAWLRQAAVRGGGDGARIRSALVVLQVALSLVLLAGAGLLGRSLLDLLRADPGFDPQGVVTLRVPLAGESFAEGDARIAFFQRVQERLASLPGVESVGAVNALPLTRNTSQTTVTFPDSPALTGDPTADNPLIDRMFATGGYFETMRIPLAAGRAFRPEDARAPARVAVIDRGLAERFFPSTDPIGQRMAIQGDTVTVIGVVTQPRLYDVHQDDRSQVFLPNAWSPRSALAFALRTDRDPAAVAAEARRSIRQIAPDQPVAEVRTMDQVVAASLSDQRLSFVLIAGFALGALLLVALGIYGVVSGVVTSRSHEIGVRMTLGAEPRTVLAMILRRGVAITTLGLALGLAGAFATGRLLHGLLVDISPSDPATLAAVAALLAAVTLLATWIPALRATRIDPARSLRAD